MIHSLSLTSSARIVPFNSRPSPITKLSRQLHLFIFSYIDVTDFHRVRRWNRGFRELTYTDWEGATQKVNIAILFRVFLLKNPQFKEESPPPFRDLLPKGLCETFLPYFKPNAFKFRMLDLCLGVNEDWRPLRLQCDSTSKEFFLKIFQENHFPQVVDLRIAFPVGDFKKFKQKEVDEIASSLIAFILSACPKLSSILVSGFPLAAIKFLVINGNQLKRLTIRNSFPNPDDDLIGLINKHENLESISVLDNFSNDRDSSNFYNKCGSIEKLKDLKLENIFDVNVDLSMVGLCNKLTNLKCFNINNHPNKGFTFIKRLENLRELYFIQCWGITGSIFNILSQLPNLRRLCLSYCAKLDWSEDFLKCQQLEEIILDGLPNFTEECLKKIHLFLNLKKLHVSVDNVKQLENLKLCAQLRCLKVRVHKKWPRKEKEISLITEQLLKLALSCHSLKVLDLSHNCYSRLDPDKIKQFQTEQQRITLDLPKNVLKHDYSFDDESI